MKTLVAAVALLAGMLFVTPSHAQAADTAPFVAACEGSAIAFLGEGNEASLPDFCGCLATQFSARPQADIDLLTKDILGTSTDSDRAAHGAYQALEQAARDTTNACFQQIGLGDQADPGVIEGDIPFVTPDMAAFDATCRASPGFLNWMSDGKMTGEQARDAICGCLVEQFPLHFQQSTVDILGKTLDGTLTDAERTAYTNYDTFAAQAEKITGQCIKDLGL
jgi:hypothetical protein